MDAYLLILTCPYLFLTTISIPLIDNVTLPPAAFALGAYFKSLYCVSSPRLSNVYFNFMSV